MFKFNIRYFIPAFLLFWVEVYIDLYVHDSFIRPSAGDFLITIWLYCAIKSCLDTPVMKTALVTLLIAYLIEISQYFHFVYVMGWEGSHIARAIFGTTFQWSDLLMYTLGILLVIEVERIRIKRSIKKMYNQKPIK